MSSLTQQKRRVLDAFGAFWLDQFTDENLILGLGDALAVHLRDLTELYEQLPKHANRRLVPLTEQGTLRFFRLSEQTMVALPHTYGEEGLSYGDGFLHGVPAVPRFRFPWDTEWSPRFLTTGIGQDFRTLERGVEYNIDRQNGTIEFLTDPFKLPGAAITVEPSVEEGSTDSFLVVGLFGVANSRDVRALQDYFGFVADVSNYESNDLYREAVQIAWDLRVEGATRKNLERILALAAGVDFVQESGTVTAVFEENDHVVVLTNTAAYTAPAGTVALVRKGDFLVPGQQIFAAYAVQSAHHETTLENFTGFLLDKGIMGSLLPDQLLLPDYYVPVERVVGPGWTELSLVISAANGDGALLTEDGDILGTEDGYVLVVE